MLRVFACVVVLGFFSLLSAQQPYGLPTAGSGGFAPQLYAPQAWLGNPGFGLNVQRGLGGALTVVSVSAAPSTAVLAGVQILADPFPPNVLLQSTLFLGGTPGVPGTGTTFFPIPLTSAPALNSLAGVTVYAQAVSFDPANPAGLSATQGLRIELTLPPTVFVGSSILNGDPYQLVDPVNFGVTETGAGPCSDNVTAAEWADGGKSIFTASSILSSVCYGDVTTSPISWSTIFTGAQGCYGLGLDETNGLLWTLTDPGTGSRELVALDANTSGVSLGTVVAQTSGVALGLIEPWTLSPSGKYAAILSIFTNFMTIVDTDPSSPTFLQVVSVSTVPVDTPGPLAIATRARFTPDDRYVLVTIQNAGATPGEVARFDRVTGTYIDHNPVSVGQQNLGAFSQPPVAFGSAPTGLSIANSGNFALVSGFGACGWVGRLDFDAPTAQVFTWTPFVPTVAIENSWTVDLSGDNTQFALGSWPSNNACLPDPTTQPQVVIMSAAGATLGTVTLPFNTNPTTLQNLYTIRYR